jgi:hypothetical protein
VLIEVGLSRGWGSALIVKGGGLVARRQFVLAQRVRGGVGKEALTRVGRGLGTGPEGCCMVRELFATARRGAKAGSWG